MTLSLYIAARFLRSFGLVTGVFALILFMVDTVEQIRRFDAEGLSLRELALLAALNLPQTLYAILPLLMVISGVALFLGLARSSELVVIRASGRSALRMLAAPVVVALLLGVLAVAAGNPIVAVTSKRFVALSERYSQGAAQAVSIGRDGVWLRQGSNSDGFGNQAVIHAVHANQDATELFDVTLLVFSPEGGPIRRLSARSARLVPGAWELEQVKDWPLQGVLNPEQQASTHASLRLPSDLTAARIRDGFGAPSAIAIWDLPDFIAGLERAGFSARRHAVWLQMELAQPLMLVAMLLVAAGFTMRHARLGRTGTMVMLALGAGLAVFFLRNFAQVLGENGQIPVALAAWAPPAAALMAALALLLHLEDG
jgi:lipopolysaccharide export system permease protein